MKRGGILHPGLLSLLACTGHTDHLTICDRGFPVPAGPERIDLALVDGIPTVVEVLKAINQEFVIDRIIATTEMAEASPQRLDELRRQFLNVRIELVPHMEFKELARSAKGSIRTGDTVPYANVIIVSG